MKHSSPTKQQVRLLRPYLLLTSENVTEHHFNDNHSFCRFLEVCTSPSIVMPDTSHRSGSVKGQATLEVRSIRDFHLREVISIGDFPICGLVLW